MSLAIVTAGAGDLDAVMQVMDDAFDPAFGEAWTRPQCLGMLALPGTVLVLACDGDVPAGFALARLIVDEAELLLLAVRPAHQRQGVASRLVAAVDRAVSQRGGERVHLEMREGNAAMALYAALGFRVVGRRADYYTLADGGRADALTLSRDLGAAQR